MVPIRPDEFVGPFFEPDSLAPGLDTAAVIFGLDPNCLPVGSGVCEGIPDLDIPLGSPNFEVIAD